jgi:hypothetical protein
MHWIHKHNFGGSSKDLNMEMEFTVCCLRGSHSGYHKLHEIMKFGQKTLSVLYSIDDIVSAQHQQ